MPMYAYRAVDATGKRLRGQGEAGSPALLLRSLEERGMLVLDVSDAKPPSPSRESLRFGRRRAVLEVTRALAALLPAGMPLARALGTAAAVATGGLSDVLHSVRGRMERGEPLASALGAHPTFFSPLYVGLVRAGERSGDLGGAFARLTEQLEREEQFRARLWSASIYPLMLAVLGGAAMVVLMLFVLPRFVELLDGAGAALPPSTALLLATSAALQQFWPVLLFLPAVAAALAIASATNEACRCAAAKLLLCLPVVGPLRRTLLAARFARLVGVLLGGGAPLFSALGDALEAVADPLARAETARVRARLREGVSLHAAIAEGRFFPPLLAQLVEVGEESSQLRPFLLKAAEIFEERAEQTMQRLVTLAEPAMIVGFGTLVAFVALSLLQAIYSVNAGAFR